MAEAFHHIDRDEVPVNLDDNNALSRYGAAYHGDALEEDVVGQLIVDVNAISTKPKAKWWPTCLETV